MGSSAPDILQKIVKVKQQEVAALRQNVSTAELQAQAEARSPQRRFLLSAALKADRNLHVVAEIKRRSPSAGQIAVIPEPEFQARCYTEGGATAISVLTDSQWFGGSLADLQKVRACTGLPLLRKDFVIDSLQIKQAAAAGADIILLIAAILEPSQAREFAEEAADYGMDVLFEIHSLAEYDPFSSWDWPIIGINNRNLHRFETDRNTTLAVLPQLPTSSMVISESGFGAAEDLRPLADKVHGFLIGEALSGHPDPATLLQDWKREFDGLAPAP